MNIGEKIKNLRESNGLTQKELGDKIGVTAVTITRYEQNQRKPNLELLQSIATALGVTIAELVENEPSMYINRLNRSGGNIDKPNLSKVSTEELIDELNKRNDFKLTKK